MDKLLIEEDKLKKVETIFTKWVTLIAADEPQQEKSLVVAGFGRKGKGTEFLWYPRYETLAGIIKLLMSLYGVEPVLTELDLNIKSTKPKPLGRRR